MWQMSSDMIMHQAFPGGHPTTTLIGFGAICFHNFFIPFSLPLFTIKAAVHNRVPILTNKRIKLFIKDDWASHTNLRFKRDIDKGIIDNGVEYRKNGLKFADYADRYSSAVYCTVCVNCRALADLIALRYEC